MKTFDYVRPATVREAVAAASEPDAAYLAAGAAFVGMGGALVDMKLIAAGDRTTIQASAREVLGGQMQR